MAKSEIAERIAAPRTNLGKPEDQVAKHLEEVRPAHDELACAQIVLTRSLTLKNRRTRSGCSMKSGHASIDVRGRARPHAEGLTADKAVKTADALLYTVPNPLGVAWCATRFTTVKAVMTEVQVPAPTA